ncbi:MAG: amino acid permease [Propionibacteriaceae bacterium]|nr:amino acid permease [Propionibacteriaceae bacterium]
MSSPTAPETLSHTQPDDNLERGLGNRHLQMIAIGGAIGTGLFMGSGKTIHLSGPSILFIYAIIGFFLYFVMRAMGEILLSNLNYRSFRDIVEDLIGPWAGFFVGWTYWLCWIVIGMADIAAVTSYVLWWFPDCPQFVPALALVLLLLGLNLVAVRLFGEIEFWFALIKIVAIVALVVTAIVLVAIGFQSPVVDAAVLPEAAAAYPEGAKASLANILNLDHGGMFPNGLTGFLGGFQIAFYAFVGIELVGTAAAETRDPERSLPKAINAIPIRVVLFYVGALAAILAVTPYLAINPDISPFVNMFALTGFALAATVVNFVVLTSAASSMNSGIYSTSRMLFGLATTKEAPRAFGKLSGSKVPANALLFSCVCVLPGVALLYASGSIMSAFTYATTLASVLFIFVWALIIVAYLLYRKRRPELHAASKYKMPLGPAMCWIVLAFLAAMIVILALDEETLTALAVSPVWFIILIVAWLIRRSRRQNDRAGATTA